MLISGEPITGHTNRSDMRAGRPGCESIDRDFEGLFRRRSRTRRIRRTLTKFANLTNTKSMLWMAVGLLHLVLIRRRYDKVAAKQNPLDVAVVPIGRTDLDGETACRLANAYHAVGARVTMAYELYKGMGRKDALLREACETRTLDQLAQGIERLPLPPNRRPSYFGPDVHGIKKRTQRMLCSYIFPLNRWLLSARPGLLVFMTDAHYATRHLCIAAGLLGIPTLRLQMNGGANDVHQDDTPYYPLFADAMVVWSRLYQRTHEANYRFSPPAHFIPLGSPKYDRLISARCHADKVHAQKPHILVISNTQFYRRHSRQCGNPAYLRFTDFVIDLLQRQAGEDFRVTLKLHPRESLDDLYRTRPGWKRRYEADVVRDAELNACIQEASGVVLMASGVITDCLLQQIPLMVLDIDDRRSGHAANTIWDEKSPLVASGAVFLAKTERQAMDWSKELVTGGRMFAAEDADEIMQLMFANPGWAAQALVKATCKFLRTVESANGTGAAA